MTSENSFFYDCISQTRRIILFVFSCLFTRQLKTNICYKIWRLEALHPTPYVINHEYFHTAIIYQYYELSPIIPPPLPCTMVGGGVMRRRRKCIYRGKWGIKVTETTRMPDTSVYIVLCTVTLTTQHQRQCEYNGWNWTKLNNIELNEEEKPPKPFTCLAPQKTHLHSDLDINVNGEKWVKSGNAGILFR